MKCMQMKFLKQMSGNKMKIVLNSQLLIIIQRSPMRQQKSHARIHQVILELREKSRHKLNHLLDHPYQQMKKTTHSPALTMENSDALSLSQTESIILPQQYNIQPKNKYQISHLISSQFLFPIKQPDSSPRREIKTARPVSRRKVTSKDKYSKIVHQRDQPLKLDVKKSQFFEQLQILQPQYFIIDKNQDQNNANHNKNSQIKSLKAFWSKSHTFVSLFPLQYTECIIYNHPSILPIYGQVQLRQKRFVVSNQYKNCSLRQLIKQFGPFDESLCRNYLCQIISGVEEMHKRKMAHNRLSSDTILYNKQGEIFINVVKSTSRALSQKEKQERLFQYSPEMLLTKNKSNSLRNDVWSIGIILLDMLFDFCSIDPKHLSFHPYNWSEEQLSQNDLIIVDNLKQLYPNSFLTKPDQQKQQQIAHKFKMLTQQTKDLISKCLLLNKDQRINIKMLKSHEFFS